MPAAEVWQRADKQFGLINWHWFFLAQPAPLPETVINAAPSTLYVRRFRLLSKPTL